MSDMDLFMKAWETHNWPIVASIVILTLVRLSKVPAAGKFWEKIPKQYRPLVPAALGVLSGVGETLTTGNPIAASIVYGFLSGLLAIGVDQVATKPVNALIEAKKKEPEPEKTVSEDEDK